MRRPPSRAAAAALLLLGACGPATPAPAPLPPAAPPAPSAMAEPSPPPPTPATIAAGAVPADAPIYAELDGVPALLKAMRSGLGGPAIDELGAVVAGAVGVPDALGGRLLDAVTSIHLGHVSGRRGHHMPRAVSVSFSDAQLVRDLIAAGVLSDAGTFGALGRRLRSKSGASDGMAWFEGPKLLVLGDEAAVREFAAVVEGRKPEHAHGGGSGDGPHAFVTMGPGDLTGAGGLFFPDPLTIAYHLWDGGTLGAVRTSIVLPNKDLGLPSLPLRPLAVARRLPAETTAYLALSTAMQGGATGVAQLLAALGATSPDIDGSIKEVAEMLTRAGVSFTDLLGALGGEGVIALALRPGVLSQKDLQDGYALLWVQDVADAKAADRVVRLVHDKISSASKGAKLHAEPGGFSVDGLTPLIPRAKVRLAKGQLFVGAGQPDLIARALLALDKGKGTLGDDPAHARALAAMPPASQARLWADFGRLAEMSLAMVPPAKRGPLSIWRNVSQGPGRATSALSFSAATDGDRIRVELDEVNGLGLLGLFAAWGVRDDQRRTKTAEARSTVAGIARVAAAAWEREQPGPNNTVVHALCKSAQPVPTDVPRGKKHVPSSQPGADWESGDGVSGWRCLGLQNGRPHYYQYTYTAGGPYKGPARGGPDPGPNGFEVAAEGDLDGDGETSLFTITGTVDPGTNTVKLSPIFVDRELE